MASFTFNFSEEQTKEIENAEGLLVRPAGEAKVRVIRLVPDDNGDIIRYNKKKNPYVMPEMEFVDDVEGTYKTMTHYVPIPTDALEGREKTQTSARFNEFCKAFGIQITQNFDFRNFIACEAEALFDVQEDEQYGDKNVIKRFL